MEEWRNIEGFEGKYKVSSYGRIWNTYKDVEVAQPLSGEPQYKYVNLHFTGRKSEFLRVHRVIAKAFIDNPDNLPIVDHIDRDKLNNHASNLRWVSNSGNQRNTDAAVFINGMHILDFVERYESPSNAYSYLHQSLKSGLSEEDAISKYEEYIRYGFKTTKVEYKGNQVYLYDLCKQLKVSYVKVSSKLYDGWDLWNALHNIKPSWENSFEVLD